MIERPFNTYIEAVDHLLRQRGHKNKWLAEKIIQPDQKLISLQNQISRWINNTDPVSDTYQTRINQALNVEIVRNSEGTWNVYDLSGGNRMIIEQIETLLGILKTNV